MSPWKKTSDYGEVPVKDARTYAMSPLDVRIANALSKRYPGMNEEQMGNSVQQEMGLGPYSIALNAHADPIVTQDSSGRDQYAEGGFYRSGGGGKQGGMIEIPDAVKNPDLRKAVMLHELSHAADAVTDPGFMTDYEHQSDATNGTPPRHFGAIQGDENWADTLEGQNLIEKGVPTGRGAPPELAQAIGNNPWLKDVAPLSSNNLANPWRKMVQGGQAVPPGVWNDTYGRQP